MHRTVKKYGKQVEIVNSAEIALSDCENIMKY